MKKILFYETEDMTLFNILRMHSSINDWRWIGVYESITGQRILLRSFDNVTIIVVANTARIM
jgi:hypothetical protein